MANRMEHALDPEQRDEETFSSIQAGHTKRNVVCHGQTYGKYAKDPILTHVGAMLSIFSTTVNSWLIVSLTILTNTNVTKTWLLLLHLPLLLSILIQGH